MKMRETSRGQDKKLDVNNNQDTSAYEAMVKMAQDFYMRYPLVDGHGNFGNIDGDSPAAMRYTEARLSKYGEAMLSGLNENTVEYIPNFSGDENEPTLLSGFLPNMILNGTTGIAVGMSSSMPPHNINDVYNALNYIITQTIEDNDIDDDKLISIIKAPDFPTGGTIIKPETLIEAYKTGQGKVIIRSNYEITKDSIIIKEIPYRVNKIKLIESIMELMNKSKDDKNLKTINGIKDIRDESDRNGMRIVIDLKKDANAQFIINNLLKRTALESNFSINNTVLVNGVPKVMNLKELMFTFLSHALDTLVNKNKFELEKANKRINSVNALIMCKEDKELLDAVINIILDSDEPLNDLLSLNFDKDQAEYIYNCKIKSLSKKSYEELINERNTLSLKIEECKNVINNQYYALQALKKEFEILQTKFSDDRKTKISYKEIRDIEEEDLIKDEQLIITISDADLIKSVSQDEYNTQKRGGKGSKAMDTKEDETIKHMFVANSKDSILFFTSLGNLYSIKAFKIPKTDKTARGKSIYNFINLNNESGEYIVNVIAANLKDKTKSLLFATKGGIIKRLSLDKLSNRTMTKIMGFKENDSLMAVLLVAEGDNIILNTAKGQALKTNINEKSIRPSGRNSIGVTGIRFKDDDYLVDMSISKPGFVFTITEQGLGKKSSIEEYNAQNRGGTGVKSHKITNKTGKVVSASIVDGEDEIFIITQQGKMIKIKASDVSTMGRSTSGVKLITLNDGDLISSISIDRK